MTARVSQIWSPWKQQSGDGNARRRVGGNAIVLTFPLWWGKIIGRWCVCMCVWGGGKGRDYLNACYNGTTHAASANRPATGRFGSQNKDKVSHPSMQILCQSWLIGTTITSYSSKPTRDMELRVIISPHCGLSHCLAALNRTVCSCHHFALTNSRCLELALLVSRLRGMFNIASYKNM